MENVAGRESTITRDSSEEEILWLETMLNRALHISTEPSAEWRPLLVEKIKQFQKSHHLKTDGVVGFFNVSTSLAGGRGECLLISG